MSDQFTSKHSSSLQKSTIHQAALLKGRGDTMGDLVTRIHKLSPAQICILILGETGTGKELCAQSIHQLSQRKHSPLVTINCAAIPSGLLNAELFGSEKNAYTGATYRKGLIVMAHGGTLFLDEVGELSLEAQAALLRVLETGELRPLGSDQVKTVDVRLICATHRDLKAQVAKGLFREDLYHRIAVGVVKLPPLRERCRDLKPIISEISPDVSRRLSLSAMSALYEYAWPGNIRELKNMLLCLEVEVPHGLIEKKDLPISSTGPWRSALSVQNGMIDAVELPIPIFNEERRSLHPKRTSSIHQKNNDQKGMAHCEGCLFEFQNDKYLVTGKPQANSDQQSPDPNSPPPAVGIGMSRNEVVEETEQLSLHMRLQQMTIEELLSHLPPLTIEEIKIAYTRYRYEQCKQNVSETARELGLSRSTTYRLLHGTYELSIA